MEVIPLPVTYGSDHFAYDFDAALSAASSSPSTPAGRVLDVLARGERNSSPPPIVDLWDASRCRHCDARFDLDADGKREHREWHEWKDANESIDATPIADELAYYETVDGLPPLSRTALETHRSKFEPSGPSATEAKRKLHAKAVDEVAALFGLTPDSLAPMVAELRREGLGVSEIAERIGSSEKSVRALLAA